MNSGRKQYSKEYDKEAVAEKVRNTLNEIPKWYCPNTLTICQERCWCYREAKVVVRIGDKWRVRYPHCANPMYKLED